MLYALLLTSCALMTQPSQTVQSAEQVATTQTVAAVQQPAQPVAAPVAVVPAPAAPAVPAATPAAVQPAANSSIDSSMDRVERRKLKQQKYAAGIDSLVMSHSFRFLPNSMQELPGGFTQLIYNQLYFIGIFQDHVEVHMPTVRGNIVQYIEILNFDTFEVKNYQTSRTQFGWSISFNMIWGSEMNFAVSLMVYNLTGEAVLNLLTMSNTVRYVGYIQSLTKN